MGEPKRFLTRLPPVPEPRPAAWTPFTNTEYFLKDVSKPDCVGKPNVARWLGAVGKFCVEARGGRVLAESALSALPSSQKG
eukprot:6958255-Pyramimonas_sp.AAC.1